MSVENDFYGNNQKWFVGVVKDTQDPKNSNRVRLRIKGIHPDEGDAESSSGTTGGGSTGTKSSSSTGPSNGTNSTTPTSSSPTTPTSSAASSGPGIIEPDRASLPKASQLDGKLSENFTLGSLTTKAAVSGAKARSGINQGLLTDEMIYNLAKLAKNCLEPLRAKYPNMIITSGWRPDEGKAGHSKVNHPGGYAVDFQVHGHSPEAIGAWVQSSPSLKGRYTKFEIGTKHNHIQIGGGKGTLSNPVVWRGKSY